MYFERRSRPFQFGITTDAAPVSGFVSGVSFRRPNRTQNKSAAAMAAALKSITTGEATSRGRARSSRFQKAAI
jgi:hypothetical protein